MFQSKQIEKSHNEVTLPTVNQIIPLNPETKISPLLYMPLEIWKYLTSYLSLTDKASLRLVCQFFFRAVLFNSPTWKQWVSANNINLFRQKGIELGWGDRPVYGLFYQPEEDVGKWYVKPPLYALDLGARPPFLDLNKDALVNNSLAIPQELTFLKLPYFSNITEDFIKLLFQKHPNLYLTLQGADLLWWACYFDWKEIVNMIISQIVAKKGPFSQVDINDIKSFYSPLAIAAQKGHIEIIELLLKQGADINYDGKCGMTPLMVATQKGNFQVVKLLLQHGANPNKINKGNQLPLIMTQVIKDNQTEDVYDAIAKLLIAFGADYSPTDTNNKIDFLDSLLTSYLQNKTIFLQEALETRTQKPQPVQNFPLNHAILTASKQWIYEMSEKIAPSHREARLMAHQVAVWLEYINLNNFIFSVSFAPRYSHLFCLLLIDYYLEDFSALRLRCPTQKLLDLALSAFQKHEFYQLRSDIQGLGLREIVKIKPPLSILDEKLSLLKETTEISNLARVILDSYNVTFTSIFKPKDKLAAALIAIARQWVLEKEEEGWPEEYANKTNIPFQSFKEIYNEVFLIAYQINLKNQARKKAIEDAPKQVVLHSNNSSQPNNTIQLQPSNSNSNNNTQQLATHPAIFFNQANAKRKSASSDSEEETEEVTEEMGENSRPKKKKK